MKENILSQSAWWIINKAVTLEIGIEASLLLSDLISKQEYFSQRKMLNKDGSFFNERKTIEEHTSLSLHKQRLAIKVLEGLGLLEISYKGIPAVTHFKVNTVEVNKFVESLHGS